jgi:formylglycine-generating enzyme required for sulfatase activity
LVDEYGNVAGVVVSKLSAAYLLARSRGVDLPENVNYAVKGTFASGFLESLPHVASKLKDPNSRAKERKFSAVVKEVQAATVLILVRSHFANSLGMVFKPVPGTDVQFCIWETRVKDYAAYAAANAGVNGSWKKPWFLGTSFTQADTHPVVNVSWEDARAFCAWLTKKELAAGKIKAGQKYRLPTDAERNAAVGLGQEKGNTPKEKDMGIKGVYPWGKEWPPPKGAGNYGGSLKVDNHKYTSPVGSFAANKLGIHDLGGNVWEWCEDWYDPAAKEYRVMRGASWYLLHPGALLSSARLYGVPGVRDYGLLGFRCVLAGRFGG